MINIQNAQLEFISRATIELSHAMGRMAKIGPSIAFIGSNQIKPNSPHYNLALEIAEVIGKEGWNCITGGGSGIHEAATLGASLGNAKSVALRLMPNEYKMSKRPDVRVKITNIFNRKVLYDLFAEAYIFFPGGFGTLDALFETLTLQQTRRSDRKPVICVGKDFWKPLLDDLFAPCLKKKFATINPEDRDLIHISENYRDIVRILWEHRSNLSEKKGLKGVLASRPASSQRAQGFANKVAMELFSAFNTFNGVGDGITVFGSSRTKPDSQTYFETVLLAQELGKALLKRRKNSKLRGAIITGGGPGNMEAANKGARLAGAPSLGLGIDLPMEQGFNPYVDEPLGYEFKYFFCRKWLFSALTDVFIAAPGGFGTLDELFEMVAHKQRSPSTNRTFRTKSIYCVNPEFWKDALGSLESTLLSNGFMAKEHCNILNFDLETDEAIAKVKKNLK